MKEVILSDVDDEESDHAETDDDERYQTATPDQIERLKEIQDTQIEWLVRNATPCDLLKTNWSATAQLRIQGHVGPSLNAETFQNTPAIKKDVDGSVTMELICADFEYFCR